MKRQVQDEFAIKKTQQNDSKRCYLEDYKIQQVII